MKVYEILSEAPAVPSGYTTTASGLVVPQSAVPTTAAPQPAPQTSSPQTTAPQTTAQKAAARSAKTTANVQRIDRLKAKGKIGGVGAEYAKLVQKLKGRAAVKDIWDSAKNAKSKLGAAKLETFLKNIGGPFAAFFRYTDLLSIVKEYYDAVGAIEEAYQNGDLANDPAESDAIFKSYISQMNGVLTSKMLAWWVHAKTSFTIAKWVARLLRLMVGATTTIGTGGIGIAAVIASEVFFIWLERWLDSDAGRDALLNGYIGMLVINVGKVEGSLVDFVFGYYKKQSKEKDNVQNKKALDTATTPDAKAAAQQKIDTTKAAQDRSDDIDALQKELK
jgi:hypothetical protein